MKQLLSKNAKYFFIGVGAVVGTLMLSGWQEKKQEVKKEVVTPIATTPSPISNVAANASMSFSAVDAAAEQLVPGNKIYHRSEALDLKRNLEQMYLANPNDMGVNLALVRYHACAPNFAGGFIGVAKQHAATIYRQNAYVGCLVYEYIYHVNNDYEHAEQWYKMSLSTRINDAMEWREVSYSKNVSYGVGVKGAFSNNKVHGLYENNYGTYKRKMQVQKCANGVCEFTMVPGYLRGANSAATGKLIFTPY